MLPLIKPVRQLLNHIALHQPHEPMGRNLRHPIISSSQLAANGSGGVGIVAEISGFQNRRIKAIRGPEAPEGRFQAVDHVAGATNRVDALSAVIPLRNPLNLGGAMESGAVGV